jgi:glycosyltransferase involved in cell wall biosynthesis
MNSVSDKIDISIITPVFNVEEYILETFQTVVGQQITPPI